MILYHYTDEEGYRGIQRDGFIRESPTGRKGRGVYLTDLDPNDRDKVAQNNYGNGAGRHRSKADHYVTVNFPDDALTRFDDHKWLFKGDISDSMFDSSEGGHISTFAIPLAIAAIAAIGAGFKMYNGRQTQAESDRMTRTNALLAGGRKDLKVDQRHILEHCSPSDCILCSRNVESDIEEYLIGYRRRQIPGYFFFALLYVMFDAVFCSNEDRGLGTKNLKQIIKETDCDLFVKKKKGFWDRLSFWAPEPLAEVEHFFLLERKCLGLFFVATLVLPLAHTPRMFRKHYWIQYPFDKTWYAVSLFDCGTIKTNSRTTKALLRAKVYFDLTNPN